MLEALQNARNKMKPPTGGTVVKQQGVRAVSDTARSVLVLSRSWKTVYRQVILLP